MNGIPLHVLQIVGGFAIVILGGELLVRSASKLAGIVRISPLVIGLTVVAFGTSAPELAITIQSAIRGSTALAVGNVVGSNILNVLLILGLSAMVAPLFVSRQLIRWDVPVMVLVSFGLLGSGLDGVIDRLDGAVMVGGLIAYVTWSILKSRRQNRAKHIEQSKAEPERSDWSTILRLLGLLIAGLVLLGLGARFLVDGSVAVAKLMGISELIIGLTVVAVGTSLPEIVTSIVASLRGDRDIAVGNIVGSNLFNILCVLGVGSIVSPRGLEVPHNAIVFDIPVMIAVAVACLPIFYVGQRIARWEGGLLFTYYVLYTVYLILNAIDSPFEQTMNRIMLFAVLPATVIVLGVAVYRQARLSRAYQGDGEIS